MARKTVHKILIVLGIIGGAFIVVIIGLLIALFIIEGTDDYSRAQLQNAEPEVIMNYTGSMIG